MTGRDLTSFQTRALQACGYEFVKLADFAEALHLPRDPVYKLARGLRKIGSMYSVVDLAAAVEAELHPTTSVKPRRCG